MSKQFEIKIDKLEEENKTFITINMLTENEEIANREVEEYSYIETETTDNDEIIELTLNELRKCLESEVK